MSALSKIICIYLLGAVICFPSSHAVFEDELKEHINTFNRVSKVPAQTRSFSVYVEEDEERDGPSPILSQVWTVTSYGIGKLSSGAGSLLRTLGSMLRRNRNFSRDEVLRTIFTDQHKSLRPSDNLITPPETGLFRQTASSTGNVLRTLGSYLSGETPTLARMIRKFWLARFYAQKPSVVLESTACAIVLADSIEGVDRKRQAFVDFVSCWNRSDLTLSLTDPSMIASSYLRGLIRAFVRNPRLIPYSQGPYILHQSIQRYIRESYRLEMTYLPCTADPEENMPCSSSAIMEEIPGDQWVIVVGTIVPKLSFQELVAKMIRDERTDRYYPGIVYELPCPRLEVLEESEESDNTNMKDVD